MEDLIEKCRDYFGGPPRAFTKDEIRAFLIQLTPQLAKIFVDKNDPLMCIQDGQRSLRERGEVVWGCLVQANSILFDKTNRRTLPANVLYSLDPYYDARVSELAALASGLFALKNTVPNDKAVRYFSDAITDEYKRVLREPLPRHICGGRTVYFATCFIQPSHLPDQYLAHKIFPLLVNYKETEGVMILPCSYWPSALISLWRSPRK